VIFAQRGGMDIFYEDATFRDMPQQQKQIIGSLEAGDRRFLLRTDADTYYLLSTASANELRLFGTT